MSSSLRDERREKLRQLQAARGSDRRRLVALVFVLIVLVVAFVQVGRMGGDGGEPEVQPGGLEDESAVALPPIDQEALAGVRDAEASDRVILEASAFAGLLGVARALLPGHLRALDEPALPFNEIEERAAELRGQAFRVRGELVEQRAVKRTAEAPQEYWSLLRTPDGSLFFFVSLSRSEELFYSENFLLADGFFFKLYTYAIDPEQEAVTAPLLVGRDLQPSFRRWEPATAVDFGLLAAVRDAGFDLETPVDQQAVWHLMNYGRTLAEDPAALEAEFADAFELGDREALEALRDEPGLRRGRPFRIPGRVLEPSYRYKRAEENPLRLEFVTEGYLGNTDLGKHPIHLLAAGKFPMMAEGSGLFAREFLGWFVQWESYVDGEGNIRLAPVFVVASVRDIELETTSFLSPVILLFLALAIGLSVFMVFMIRRDRTRARQTLRMQQERRQRRAEAARE